MIQLSDIPHYLPAANIPEEGKQVWLEDLLKGGKNGVGYILSGSTIIIVNKSGDYVSIIEAEVKKYKCTNYHDAVLPSQGE